MLRAGALAVLAFLAPTLAMGGTRSPADVSCSWPDPFRSGVGISGQGASCQFRFHPAGDVNFNADVLTVDVTVRDAFDVPIPGCSTSVTLAPYGPDTHNFCTCCGEAQSAITGPAGTIQVTWDRIGGFGSLEVRVVTHCAGDIAIAAPRLEYTSSDLTGICDESTTPVDIHDLALWARGLPPGEWVRSDWDCSGGAADVIDAGAFAAGMDDECNDGGPCP